MITFQELREKGRRVVCFLRLTRGNIWHGQLDFSQKIVEEIRFQSEMGKLGYALCDQCLLEGIFKWEEVNEIYTKEVDLIRGSIVTIFVVMVPNKLSRVICIFVQDGNCASFNFFNRWFHFFMEAIEENARNLQELLRKYCQTSRQDVNY